MNVKVLANGGLKRDNLNPGFRLRRGNLSDIALQVRYVDHLWEDDLYLRMHCKGAKRRTCSEPK
jgi:hypothetical protein